MFGELKQYWFQQHNSTFERLLVFIKFSIFMVWLSGQFWSGLRPIKDAYFSNIYIETE